MVRLPINLSTASREGLSLLLSNTIEGKLRAAFANLLPFRLLNQHRDHQRIVANTFRLEEAF